MEWPQTRHGGIRTDGAKHQGTARKRKIQPDEVDDNPSYCVRTHVTDGLNSLSNLILKPHCGVGILRTFMDKNNEV